MRPIATLCALALFAPVALADNQPELVLPTQGFLLGPDDTPVNGTVSLTFKIHPRESEAAGQTPQPLWTATYETALFRGSYAVSLGDLKDETVGGTPLPFAIFEEGERWLEVHVGEQPLSPRLRLGVLPAAVLARRALEADDAALLDGHPAEDFALVDHDHDEIYLTPDTAAETFLTIADAGSTYLTIDSAASTYVTAEAAAATYQPVGSYLTTDAAQGLYQPTGSYLTVSEAQAQYVPAASASQFATAPKETFLRGAALGGEGAQFDAMEVEGETIVLEGVSVPDLVVASGETFTVPDEEVTYRNVTVRTGGVLKAAAWNGSAGGRVRLRVLGTLTVEAGGTINVKGLGYRGGVSLSTRARHGEQGESYTGPGIRTNCTRNAGGGGGGQTDSGNYGQAGAGGGYGTVGAKGLRFGGQGGCDAEGGTTYGDEDLTELHLGSGGGSAGTDGDKSGRGGDGGRGGGAIAILAQRIVVHGTLDARGDNGTDAYAETDNGGGGGGSGGSVLLWADEVRLETGSNVTVAGGNGGAPRNANTGGKGGDGRLLLKGRGLVTAGTLTGAARKLVPGAAGPGLSSAGSWISPVVNLPSGTQLAGVDVFARRTPQTGLVADVCVGSSIEELEGDCWRPLADNGDIDPGSTGGPLARVRVRVAQETSGGFALMGVRLRSK